MCHLIIKIGLLRFLDESTHSTKQIVELWLIEDYPEVCQQCIEAAVFLVGSKGLNEERIFGRCER